jgi:hypothetical protein
MMLTIDEYMALRRLIESERESEGAEVVQDKPKRRRSRTARANDKKMSKALEKANADLRKKNGDLKKGVTQGMIMSRAHRLRKKM